jgi:TonB family protein
MNRRNLVIVLAFVVPSVAPSLTAFATQAFSQEATGTPAVVLSRIEIRYPSIAQSAGVRGTVSVRVGVRPDGSVAETTLVKGKDLPILNDAAKDAASGATFECRGCTEPSTPHVIVFVFLLGDDKLPTTWKQTSDGSSEVTVVDEAPIYYGGPPPKMPRAARCLWLWRCGYQYHPAVQ